MPIEGMAATCLEGRSSEGSFNKGSMIQCMAEVVVPLENVNPTDGGPASGLPEYEGCLTSNSLESSVNHGSTCRRIVEGPGDHECDLSGVEITNSHDEEDLPQAAQPQDAGCNVQAVAPEKLNFAVQPGNQEMAKYQVSLDLHYSELPENGAQSEEAAFSSSETGACVEDNGKPSDAEKDEGGVVDAETSVAHLNKQNIGEAPSVLETSRKGDAQLRSPEGINEENSENLCTKDPPDEMVTEGSANTDFDVNGDSAEKPIRVGTENDGAVFDSSHTGRGRCLEGKITEPFSGEVPFGSSDGGGCFDGKISEKSFNSASRHEVHHRHSRGSGASTGCPNPALVERLYNPPHICNHVRCAANNPDYAMRQLIPPKKYLVAKKHTYGGVSDKSRRTSCDHDGASEKSRRRSCDPPSEKSRRTSCDHDKSYALNSLINHAGAPAKPRRISGVHDKTNANLKLPLVGKSRRSSADHDKPSVIHAHSVSGAHHKRGKSTPPVGFTPHGNWNSSVAIDKGHGEHGFWNPSVPGDKKHGEHGSWSSSVAIDKKLSDNGPWNGSVAVDKKSGERKNKAKFSSPGGPKKSINGDLLRSSRRTSTESTLTDDRRQKPRRSSFASDVAEDRSETRSGNVSGLTDDGRSSPGNLTSRTGEQEGSPSASVGSNHTDRSSLKEALLWSRQQQSSEASCVNSGHWSASESLASIARSDARVSARARYELPTVASKLPKLSPAGSASSQSLSDSTTGSGASKPSWNSSTTKMSIISTPPSAGSVTNTSSLAKTFITKLKESTRNAATAAAGKAPSLPSWNSSITVAPNLFDYSTTTAYGATKIARKFITDLKQSSQSRKAIKGVAAQVNDHSKNWNLTPGVSADASSKEMTVPIPESSAEKHVDPGFPNPSTPTSKLTRYGSMREGSCIPTPTKISKVASMKEKEKESKIPGALKFSNRGRTTSGEDAPNSETVNLKRGETAERRLSEEYMTDHTLATTISKDIQGGRVRSLVHAFESLKTGPDAEHHHSNDETVRSQYLLELATLPPSPSQIAV